MSGSENYSTFLGVYNQTFTLQRRNETLDYAYGIVNIHLDAPPQSLTLTSDGKFGINTTTPKGILSIHADDSLKGEVTFFGNGGMSWDGGSDGDFWFVSTANESGVSRLGWFNGSEWFVNVNIHNTGSVDIGRTSYGGFVVNRGVVNILDSFNASRGFDRGRIILFDKGVIWHDFGYDGGGDGAFWFSHVGDGNGYTAFVWNNESDAFDRRFLLKLFDSGLVTIPSGDLIVSGGRIGVGTTSPAYELDVKGSISLPNNGKYGPTTIGYGLYIADNTSVPRLTLYRALGNALRLSGYGAAGVHVDVYGGTSFYVKKGEDDSALFTVNSGTGNTSVWGNLGVRTSSPSEALYVVGNGYFTGTVTQNSDVRVKVNVSVLNVSVLDGLRGLRPVLFGLDLSRRELLWGWRLVVDHFDEFDASTRSRVRSCLGGRSFSVVVNDSFVDWGVVRCVVSVPGVRSFLESRGVRVGEALDGSLGVSGGFVGFVAQDVAKSFPFVVRRDSSTGLLSVSYTSMVPLLARGLVELDDRVSRLERGGVLGIPSGGNVSFALRAENATRAAVADFAKNASHAFEADLARNADMLSGYRLEDITSLIQYGFDTRLDDASMNETHVFTVRVENTTLIPMLARIGMNETRSLPRIPLSHPPLKLRLGMKPLRILTLYENETILYTFTNSTWNAWRMP